MRKKEKKMKKQQQQYSFKILKSQVSGDIPYRDE